MKKERKKWRNSISISSLKVQGGKKGTKMTLGMTASALFGAAWFPQAWDVKRARMLVKKFADQWDGCGPLRNRPSALSAVSIDHPTRYNT